MLFNILEKYGKESDAVCFCGDGMPDLLGVIEDFRNIDGYEERIPKLVVFVQGNGDYANYQLVTDDRHAITVPQQTEFTAAGKKVMMTHGHRYNVYIGTKELKAEAERIGADIVFYDNRKIGGGQLGREIRLFRNQMEQRRRHGILPLRATVQGSQSFLVNPNLSCPGKTLTSSSIS